MKYTIYKNALILLISVGFVFTACNDEWDSHYQEDIYDGAETSMMEYLEANSDLSTFTSLVKQTGYDDILNTSQVFTVWAPNNEALAGIDVNDELFVENLVKNHITRGRIGTSGISLDPIKMQSGKNIDFETNGGGYMFGDANLTQQNVPLNNGLIHKLDGYAPYLYNIKEYIGETEGFDSLKNYIFGKDVYEFDPVNSTELEINDEGQVVYDSVFVYTNELLSWIGEIYNEDSVYTAILPTNAAWNEAYDRIKPYFNLPDDLGSEEYSDEYTKNRIVENMTFMGEIDNPAQYDSIQSRAWYFTPSRVPNSYANTTIKRFFNVEELFANKEQVEMSNGLVYIADQMPFLDSVFFKKIQLEAEYSDYRENSNSEVFNRSSYGSDLDVSNDYYLYVEPISTSAKPSVTFMLNNILSATYDISCVFVPESIAGDTLETKVSFVLTYINSATGRVRRQRVTPEDNVVKAEGMTKMHALRWDFEWANVRNTYENMELPVQLEVINEVSDAEASDPDLKLTRRMRIDCIMLEPVTE